MYSKPFILQSIFVCLSCQGQVDQTVASARLNEPIISIAMEPGNPYKTINEIRLPAGFSRSIEPGDSFANWLRELPLKKDKTVYLYNGRAKVNQDAQFAVLDVSVGDKDLQQCADAVMRLRAEYLFAFKKYNAIQFRDNEGKWYRFSLPHTGKQLQAYLKGVFAMCGSASLAKQLVPKPFTQIEAGDILIRGGFPGHAVQVMDVAVNKQGKKIYLLAQSYMPAQDIHVLMNPVNQQLSPWYEVNDAGMIETPEYRFTRNELKTW